jgi:hypothetical protein
MKRRSLCFSIFALFFTTSIILNAADSEFAIRFPGTNVNIVPPRGFFLKEGYPILMEPETNAIIVMEERREESVAQAVANITSQTKLQFGSTVLSKETIERDHEQSASLLNMKQRTPGGNVVLHWVFIFPSESGVVSLDGMCLESDAKRRIGSATESLSESIKKSVLTGKWEWARSASIEEGLGFQIESRGNLSTKERWGYGLRFGEPGRQVDADDAAVFSAQTFPVTVQLDALEALARETIDDLESFERATVKSTRPVRIDGLQGVEVLANARSREVGRQVMIYLVIVAEPQQYWKLAGRVNARRQDELLPIFRSMAESFHRTESGRKAPKPELPSKEKPKVPTADNTMNLQSLLINAVAYGDTKKVKTLLDEGADADTKDSKLDMSVLSMAAALNYSSIVELLLSKGADPNTKDRYGNPDALYAAITAGSVPIVKILLASGTKVNAKTVSWAEAHGNPEIIRLIKTAASKQQ